MRWVLEDEGVSIEGYALQSYGVAHLTGIRYASEGLDITVKTLQAPTLPALVWALLTDNTILLEIQHGQITENSAAKSADSAPSAIDGMPALAQALLGYEAALESYNLNIQANDLRYQSGDLSITVPALSYADRKLSTTLASNQSEQVVELSANRASDQETDIVLKLSPVPVTLAARLQQTEESETRFSGSAKWHGQTADFSAAWEGTGWVPDGASLSANDWSLPESILAPEYRQGYGSQVASLEASWDGKTYRLSLDGKAQPEDAELPPLTAEVTAKGNLDSLTVNTINLQGDWIEGQLYEPVTVSFANLEDMPPFDFALTADLNRQNLLPLKGTTAFRLSADDRPGEAYPEVTAVFSGKQLAYAAYSIDLLQAEAVLDWPALSVNRFLATLGGDSSLALTGHYDLEKENLSGLSAQAQISGSLLKQYGLNEPAIESASLNVKVEGPYQKPRHEGSLKINKLAWAEDTFDIQLDWQGEHGELEALAATGKGEALDFAWDGRASIGVDSQSLTLQSARLQSRELAAVTLQQPVTLRHEKDGQIRLSPLLLKGGEGGHLRAEGTVGWPGRGQVELEARRIGPVWLKLLTDGRLPFPAVLDSLQASASWDKGPMKVSLQAKALGIPEGQEPFAFAIQAEGDHGGLQLGLMTITQGEAMLANASGLIPLLFIPGETPLVQLDTQAEANFNVSAQPGATPLWRWVQTRYGLLLEAPSVELRLSGSLSEPGGMLKASLRRLVFPETEALPSLPEIEYLDAYAGLTPDTIALEGLRMAIAGQTLEASGRLPMSRQAWLALLTEAQPPELTTASASLRFEDVPLASFKSFLPPILRPAGQFSIRAEIKPGLDWRGELTLQGIESMPLPKLGSITDIGADLTLNETALEVQTASALIGGQEIAITGKVGIAEPKKPQFDLRLNGESVPFVRDSGLIVRGSPELTLKTNQEAVTTLAGKVTLNESFYTVDLTSLGQGNDSDPNRRFPYFSIQEEPLASWQLAIDVEGDNFMRVRTPVFEGVVSTDLELRGTLQEPLATGQAAIQKGVVLFPFANFRIEQGTVTIRQDQPFDPVLDVTAAGRAYGYDIIMRLTGSPEEPQLTFTSTPALEQGDILLMVTAGRMPDSDERSTGSRLTGLGIFIGNTILVDMGIIDPLDDSLQVYIGEDVTLTGRDTIRVFYRINDTWALAGQYDRFDAYTLDLQWTIYEE